MNNIKYFIDLDTLCITLDSNYINSTPIIERISYVNDLKITKLLYYYLDSKRFNIWNRL